MENINLPHTKQAYFNQDGHAFFNLPYHRVWSLWGTFMQYLQTKWALWSSDRKPDAGFFYRKEEEAYLRGAESWKCSQCMGL